MVFVWWELKVNNPLQKQRDMILCLQANMLNLVWDISWYLCCMVLPQTAGSAIVLLALTNCFVIFQLQFHQTNNPSWHREGDPCIYIPEPFHPLWNKDVIQTSVEVRFHLWFVVTRLERLSVTKMTWIFPNFEFGRKSYYWGFSFI